MSLHGNFLDIDFGGGGRNTSRAIDNQSLLGFGDTSTDVADAGIFGEGGFFGKGGGASLALGGIQTLGSLWSSFQQTKLAKKTLNFQKDAFRTNLRNATKVYNNSLEDRINARFATEGRPEEAEAKIAESRL